MLYVLIREFKQTDGYETINCLAASDEIEELTEKLREYVYLDFEYEIDDNDCDFWSPDKEPDVEQSEFEMYRIFIVEV